MGRPDPRVGEDEQQELKRLEIERRVGCVKKESMMPDPLQSNAMPNPLLGSQQEVALEAGDMIRWIFASYFFNFYAPVKYLGHGHIIVFLLVRVSQGQQEVTVERIDRV